MEVEKRGSKGGFLQLFDWNGKSKSRKKLFSNKSELPGSKQGNDNVDNLIKEDQSGIGLSYRPSSNYIIASSASGDGGHGTRAPGVVARLMGLDSLPSSTVCEPHITSLFDSCSLRDPHNSKTTPNFVCEHQIMEYNIMHDEFEGSSRNPVKSRPQKMHTLPIERFQTEILPPKSAKSIPITHNKLLSPIKSPGFIPKKNAAYIMEVAAKFIESGSQATIKGKMPSFGPSSVPLRIQDLREKMEAAQKLSKPEKPKEPDAVRNLKGQSRNRRWNASQDTPMFRACADSERNNSESSKNKEKSVSLAIQAKVNIQRRKGLTSSGNRSLKNQKELTEVKSNQIFKSQPDVQKSAQKRTSTSKTSRVLKQNNQKQNCISNEDRLTTKASGSGQQARQVMSVNGSSGPSKTIKRVVVSSESGPRKTGSAITNIEKGLSLSKTRNFSQKKQSINRDFPFEESFGDNVLSSQDERPMQCNVAIDGSMNQGVDNGKKCMDIVSFTFTSPIKRSIPTPQFSGQVMEKNDSICIDSSGDNDFPDLEYSNLCPLGLNIISGDALSFLLEQKLRELTCKVESSHCNLVQARTTTSSASSLQDSVSTLNVIGTIPMELEKRLQLSPPENKSDNLFDFNCSSTDGLVLKANQKCQFQDLEGIEEHCSSCNSGKSGMELDCQLPIPASILEPSSSSGSCNSSYSRKSDNNSGGKHLSSIQSEEAICSISTTESQLMEGDTELSDSASSMPSWDLGQRHTITTFSFADSKISTNWELEYVRNIICRAELLYKEFALGQDREVLKRAIFNQLENQKSGSERSGIGSSRLERKFLFDCVSECLDLRCQQLSAGGCKSCFEWVTLFQRTEWLAEELYKEIRNWRSMGELMVDELVDKDMSSRYGRWLDFEIEAYEEGVEIEKDILACLVDELVDDLFLF